MSLRDLIPHYKMVEDSGSVIGHDDGNKSPTKELFGRIPFTMSEEEWGTHIRAFLNACCIRRRSLS